MIWHIFKKDFRRLWPFVAGLVLADFAKAVLQAALGPFPDEQTPMFVAAQLAAFVILVLPFFLAVMAVQLDPLNDDRQDWLVRPIWRRNLLLAKLLFVALCIQLPMLAADLLQGLASGLSLGQMLAAALWLNLYRFATLSLMAMAIGALTRSIGQMLGLAAAVLAGVLAIVAGVAVTYYYTGVSPDNAHTMASFVLENGTLMAGMATILGVQYFRRATFRGRVIFAATSLLALAGQVLLPTSAAYAIQNALSSAPGQDIAVSFAPGAGKLAGALHLMAADDTPLRTRAQDTTIALPLHVTGLPPGMTLIGEAVTATLAAPDGKTDTARIEDKLLERTGEGDPAAPSYLEFPVSAEFWRAHANQNVRLDLSLVFSVIIPRGSYNIPATGGTLPVPGIGRCTTRVKDTAVQLGCLGAGDVRVQMRAVLTDTAHGLSNPSWVAYTPNDAPFRDGPDIVTRINGGIAFADANVVANYPVGPAQLPNANVVITVSKPLAHILRHITIPTIRLSDWKADAAKAAP